MQYTVEELRQLAKDAMDGRTQKHVAGVLGRHGPEISRALSANDGTGAGILCEIVREFRGAQIYGPVKVWEVVIDE